MKQCSRPFSSCDFITMATSRVDAAVLLPNGGRRRGEPLAPHEDALQLDYDTTKGRKRGRGWVGKENRGRALSDIHNTGGRDSQAGLIRCTTRYYTLNLITPHSHYSHRNVKVGTVCVCVQIDWRRLGPRAVRSSFPSTSKMKGKRKAIGGGRRWEADDDDRAARNVSPI